MRALALVVSLALLAAPAAALPAGPDAARAEIRRAFLAGSEGPDPSALEGEPRALAAGLKSLRAGTTLDRVAAFAQALDPAAPALPPDEVVAFYIRTPRPAGGAGDAPDPRPAALRAAELRARVERAMALARAGLPGDLAAEAPAVPRRAPSAAPAPRAEGSIRVGPAFASAERGSVAPAVNAVARAEIAAIDERLADHAARRREAWDSGRPWAAAGLAAVSGAGRVLKATWDLVGTLSGERTRSAKAVAGAVLYQPEAVLDYRERQSALPSPSRAPGAYAAGSALNVVFLAVEVMPGSRLAKDQVRAAYKELVHDSRDALHQLEAAEDDLRAAVERAELAPPGTHERALHQMEAAEARARFEMMRVELDAARRRMVDFHLSHTLDHEFHGSVEARPMSARDVSALNDRFVREGGSPPFHADVPLYEVALTKPIELCRAHRTSDLERLRATRSADGDWFVPCHTLEHLDQKHLRDLLALPDTNAADYVARFTVPAGTKFYVGAAGPIRGESSGRVERMYTDAEGRAVGGGGNGGKLQFFLDPHINAPEIAASDAAALTALAARQAELRRSIVYHGSTAVPASSR